MSAIQTRPRLARRLIAAAAVAVGLAGVLAQPASASSANPDPARYPIKGVDVTEYQHPGGASVNWSQIRQSGVTFATLKATRGTNKTNPYFGGDLGAALAQRIATAPYHYLTGTSSNAVAQADFFISTVRAAGYTGHRAGELPPILDLEWTDDGTSSCPPYTTVAFARTWLDRVQAAFGVKPWIYTANGFMTSCMGSTTAFGSYGLQVADYISSHTTPAVPPGWSSWLMWQYADVGSVPGVPTTNVTKNVFNGTQAYLDQLSGLSRPVVDPQAGRLVDFDGDGKPDFLGLGASGDDMWFIPNTSSPGTPARGQSIPISTGWKTVTKYWLTDYDGDGKTDILGLNGTDQMLAWINTSSPGHPSATAAVDLGTQWSTLSKIVIADFTGDGKVDIAGVDAATGDQFWVVPNTSAPGAPARGQSMHISDGWKTVTRFWVTDYDGDSKTDLLGLNGTDQMLAWRSKGTAVPSFYPYADLGTQWSTLSKIVIGDFTADGKVDIAGVNAATGDQFWVVPNTSTPGAPARGQSIPVSDGWKTVTTFLVADYDRDGKTDLLGLNGTDQMLAWRSKGTAVPSFDPYTDLGTQWSTISHIPTAQ
ncbi:hypothetical protein Aple_073050 [Acrocarpospora pleiomorpha]|uniref:Lysozyme n=1 Tax=Acrocarpospora pleiomorpha TaxID=90975 RepID=A0A5M3XU48_9ACTN|nr:GH25 family lysozyme [Acrocarpospora pleiomorpha]GES24406.1 hypothetical protein Aple_073050 [Acrocarpospora pleiomorpha]